MDVSRIKWLVLLIVSLVSAFVEPKEKCSLDEDTHSRKIRQVPPMLRRPLHGYAQIPPSGGGQISINFINKSGRRIRMFKSSSYGHEIRFQFFMRPNEPRRVSISPDASFWVAYDIKTNLPLLINGYHRLESYYIRNSMDAKITSRQLRPDPIKRDRSVIRFVETQVVADDSMLLHHGEEQISEYITLLMNMVARTFLHRSFGAPVYLAVTGINIMRKRPDYYQTPRDRPDISVTSACKYARSVKGNASVDFSLILTREDIGPAGYAAMYTMCTKRSCALVKETGPDTAYVIAHELAHALGIDHDESDRCPRHRGNIGNLMFEQMYATSSNYQWSKCSGRMIWENLKYFNCLTNKPKMLDNFRKSMRSLPGQLMNRTLQCQHFQGPDAKPCIPFRYRRFNPTCRTLFCQSKPNAPCQPLRFFAPLEGSMCAKGKWCKAGNCIKQVKIIPVDGGWSNFTDYSPPCDINTTNWIVQQRNRSCTNPRPQFSGKKCKGKAKEYRVLLPAKNGICQPYSLRNLMLNGKIDLNQFEENGCSTLNKKTKWRAYPVVEQKEQVNNLNLTCDFESRGCAWKSSKRGVKAWNTAYGSTPSVNTGPIFDHTFKTKRKGHFIYLEASWASGTKPLKNGDRVILESPKIMSAQACLKFAYHMHGASINRLEVYIRRGNDSYKLWTKKRQQGNKWHIAEIDLAISIEYKITIEAVRGRTYYSDIAIDDISLNHGFCGTKTTSKEDEAKHSCTTVCVNQEKTSMRKLQLSDGFPCQLPKSKNNVCFKRVCQPVNCHGVIGGRKC